MPSVSRRYWTGIFKPQARHCAAKVWENCSRPRGLVRDPNKQQLAYVYFENEPGRRSAAKLLTKDDARPNIAKLPELLRKPDQ